MNIGVAFCQNIIVEHLLQIISFAKARAIEDESLNRVGVFLGNGGGHVLGAGGGLRALLGANDVLNAREFILPGMISHLMKTAGSVVETFSLPLGGELRNSPSSTRSPV